MQSKSDIELLRDYSDRGDELAFREIVTRHAALVYASALRQVGSPDLARDLAQSVFTDLARKASSLAEKLSPNASLSGWLYRSTRFAALKHLRDDRRRQERERQAMEHFNPTSDPALEWERLQPVLDEALSDLTDEDRDALLLRYFKNHNFQTIGTTLGVSDDTAQKRVSRALDRLRQLLISRGITTTAAALSLVLITHAMPVAPAGLVATLSTAALSGTTATATKAIAMTALQKTVATAVVIISVATPLVMQMAAQQRLRHQDETLRQQANQMAALQKENQRLTTSSESSGNTQTELQKLRSKTVVLRNQTSELTALQNEERQLQAYMAKVRQDLRLNDTNAQPTAGSKPLQDKISYCMNLSMAMWEYASDHQDHFPTNFDQAAKYLAARTKNQTNFTSDQFQIVFQGTTADVEKYAHSDKIIMVQEKEPWTNTDGKLVKAWTDIRGIGHPYSPANGNFDVWEKQHIISPE